MDYIRKATKQGDEIPTVGVHNKSSFKGVGYDDITEKIASLEGKHHLRSEEIKDLKTKLNTEMEFIRKKISGITENEINFVHQTTDAIEDIKIQVSLTKELFEQSNQKKVADMEQRIFEKTMKQIYELEDFTKNSLYE